MVLRPPRQDAADGIWRRRDAFSLPNGTRVCEASYVTAILMEMAWQYLFTESGCIHDWRAALPLRAHCERLVHRLRDVDRASSICVVKNRHGFRPAHQAVNEALRHYTREELEVVRGCA